MAPDVPHRYATRSWPKALGSRLYGSLIRTFGITAIPAEQADAGKRHPQRSEGTDKLLLPVAVAIAPGRAALR